MEKEGADVFIVARDRSRFLAHKAIISCRSEVLAGLLADAAASDEKPDAAGEIFVLLNVFRSSLTHEPLEISVA